MRSQRQHPWRWSRWTGSWSAAETSRYVFRARGWKAERCSESCMCRRRWTPHPHPRISNPEHILWCWRRSRNGGSAGVPYVLLWHEKQILDPLWFHQLSIDRQTKLYNMPVSFSLTQGTYLLDNFIMIATGAPSPPPRCFCQSLKFLPSTNEIMSHHTCRCSFLLCQTNGASPWREQKPDIFLNVWKGLAC